MTVPDGVELRPGVPADADLLARLHVDVWEDAYTDLMPAAVFEERRATITDRIDRWRTILGASASRTTVAEIDGGLIGFASTGPARDDDVTVEDELWALYVRASWWGRQVGHALLLSMLGDRPAYVWVLHGNDRAIAFYGQHGFAPDGVTRTDEYGAELRMVRHC